MEAQLDEAMRSNQIMHQIVADDRMHIANLTAQVRSVISRSEISAAVFHQTLAAMDQQQDALELERVGEQARIDAIQAAIAHTAEQAAMKAAGDPTFVELSKVADARVKSLEMLKGAPAGAVAAKSIGQVISVQVIPRPHDDLGAILPA